MLINGIKDRKSTCTMGNLLPSRADSYICQEDIN